MGFWLLFLVYAALFVLSELLRPKPDLENAKPSGLGDFRFPTATEGRPIPLIWGTVPIAGPNVVWWGDLVQEAITVEVKTGMFSSENQIVGFKYSVGIQQALCMGPVDELRRVWIGDKLVFDGSVTHDTTFTIDEPELFGGDELGNGGVVGTLRLFSGTSTQAVSSYLAEFQKEPPGTGDTPAYRDLCYIAPDVDPVYIGNSTSIKPWKMELRRCPNGLALTSGRHVVNSADANPAAVLYEVLTNADWGKRVNPALINATNFRTAGNTLFDEGNGFSFQLDRVEDIGDLVRRIEQQIDGVTYKNPATGLWEIKLFRADYDPLTITEINDTNIHEIRSFTRGTWEGTSNQVRIPFADREDEWKETYGFAQDMANVRIVGGNVSVTIDHPGIKNKTLANAIAWRELRTLAYPLAQGEFILDRSLSSILPGDVLAFTDADLDFVRLPMRVKTVDYGTLSNGDEVVVAELVQDVFFAAVGSFNPNPASGWTPPSDTLVAFPSDEQRAIEAPRAITLRDPLGSGPYVDKLFAFARRQGPEVSFKMMQRHAAGSPAGPFAECGEVFNFTRIGSLNLSLSVGSAVPASSILVTPGPDTQGVLETLFPDIADVVELGTDLVTLILVDEEFMLVSSANTTGANVQLNNVYRGVLDSVQAAHSAGADVFLVFVGAGVSDDSIPAGHNVDVKLLPRSLSDLVAEGAATTISFAMANRTRRPYAPCELSLNGSRFSSSTSLEGTGSGEATGIGLAFRRRDFRTIDEIAALMADAATLFPDFPGANTTVHEVEVRADPSGANTLLFTQSLAALASGTVRRLDILEATDGDLPTTLRFRLRAKHTFDGTDYSSRYDLVWDFAVTSALTGFFEFGALAKDEDSANFVVVNDTTDHVFTLSSAFTVGDVEYRINGGSWTTLITAGGTSGTIPNAAIVAADVIEIVHRSTDTNAQKLITMAAGSTPAFGVLYT